MASRAKADITERWWKQAWPVENEQPDQFREVTSAIKAYKAAKRGLSQSDLLKALQKLDEKLALSAACSKRRKLDKKRLALFTNDVVAVRKIVQALQGDAMRVGDAEETVYSRDISKTLNENLNATLEGLKDKNVNWVSRTKVEYKLLVAVVNEIKAKGGDGPLLRAYNDTVDDAIAKIGKRIRSAYRDKTDAAFFRQRSNMADFEKTIKKIIDEELADAHQNAVRVPTKVLHKLGVIGEIQKTYETRMLKKAGKAAVSSVSAAAAITSAVILPGAAPLAIYGACMASASALRDIADMAMSLEKKTAVLAGYVEAEAKRLDKLRDTASCLEGPSALINELTGIGIFPTLKKVKADFKDIEKGILILQHRAHVKQKNIGTAIDNLAKFEKEVAGLKARNQPFTKNETKALKTLEAQVKKSSKYMADLGKAAVDITVRASKIEVKYDRLKAEIDRMTALESKVKSVQKMADGIKIVSTLAVGAYAIYDARTYTECGKLYKDAERNAAIAIASVSLAKDSGELIKEHFSGGVRKAA